MIDSRVDLPQPEAPSRHTSSPSSTCRSTRRGRSTEVFRPAKTFDTPSTTSFAVPGRRTGETMAVGVVSVAVTAGPTVRRGCGAGGGAMSLTRPMMPNTISRANITSTARKRCARLIW